MKVKKSALSVMAMLSILLLGDWDEPKPKAPGEGTITEEVNYKG
jgi:hypothetical protein